MILFAKLCADWHFVLFSMEESQRDYTSILVRTMNFAAIKHKTQKRKDVESTPYINHPIGE